MKKIFILILFLFLQAVSAQNNDSLQVYQMLQTYNEIKQSNPERAWNILKDIEQYSLQNGYRKGIYLVAKERAKHYYETQQYDSSLTQLNLIKPRILSIQEQARFYNLKGVNYQALGKTDSALRYLNKSLKIYRKINNVEGIITALTNTGINLFQANLPKEALKNFEEAYQLALKHKKYEYLTAIINNYASLLVINGQTEKAENLFKQLFERNSVKQNPRLKFTLLINWATFKKAVGKLDEAEKWYIASVKHAKQNNLNISPKVYIGLGQVYLKKNQPGKALENFYRALELGPGFPDKKMIYNAIADSYLKLNKPDSTVYYLKKLNRLIEKNYNSELKKTLAETKNNLEVFKKDFEIKLLKKDKHILALKNKTNRYVILSLTLLLILISSIIYWTWKQQKLKQRQWIKEMKLKEQTLMTSALKILQKNQLLLDLKQKIENLEMEDRQSLKKLQKEIKTAITNAAKNDKDWEQFEIFFNDLHKGFYQRLKKQYPELTDNDLRICSLIKLRFTTKEISNLLFLSPETIKSTRYRIRKKLNLPQDRNLSDFLNKI